MTSASAEQFAGDLEESVSAAIARADIDGESAIEELVFTLGQVCLELLAREVDPEKRLALAQDVRTALTSLADEARDMANTAAVCLLNDKTQVDVASELKVSSARLSQIASRDFSHVGIAGEAGTSPEGDLNLGLSHDQQILTGLCVLYTLDRQIAALSDPKWSRRLQTLRGKYLNLLSQRAQSLATAIQVTTPRIDLVSLRDQLSRIDNPGRLLAILVEVSATDPLSSFRAQPLLRVPQGLEVVRLHAVDEVFAGIQTTSQEDLTLVHRRIASLNMTPSALRWAAIGSAAASVMLPTVILPGVLPLLPMTLGAFSSAAATSAALAYLGGGSLATTGLGMAGGTALLALAGAAGGSSQSALSGRSRRRVVPMPTTMAEGEADKLAALVLLLRRHGDLCQLQADRYVEWAQEQLAFLEREVSLQAPPGSRDPRSTRSELENRIVVLRRFLEALAA